MQVLDPLRNGLGLPEAPVVQEGLATADQFFRDVLHLDPIVWIGYLRGIDFHKPVRVEMLPRGTRLIRYDSMGDRSLKPFSYFTRPGVSQDRLGTNFPSVEYKEYETVRSINALRSTASGIKFGITDRVSRPGGGVQYIIGFADSPALTRVGGRPGRP